jgi:ribose transport system ATP-binding protein
MGDDATGSESSGLRLEVKDLVKDYPGARVVDEVSFEVRAGEIHGIIGENGAGKSTIIKIVSGAVTKTSGTILLDGMPVDFGSSREAHASGVSVVWQELSLVPYFNAPENVFLGHPYPKTKLGLTDGKALAEKAAGIFRSLGVGIPLKAPVSELSPANQAIVAIARALAVDAKLLILDEPTAPLTNKEIKALFKVLRVLRDRGNALVYITHRLEEIMELADRVTVLRNGKRVATVNKADTSMDALITMMIGRTLEQMYPARTTPVGDPILEVEDLTGPGVKGVSFTLGKGEVLGVAGLTGSGRTEVLRMLAGAVAPSSGHMSLAGKRYWPSGPSAALRSGVGFVPEERRALGLVMPESVGFNLVLSSIPDIALGRALIKPSSERALGNRLVRQARVKTTGLDQGISELSGGNQQKALFGRQFARELRLLLLDEPTRGVDVGSKHEIYETVRTISASGTAVVLVSSDLPEIIGLADRILVMREGRQCGIVPVDEETTGDGLLSYCYRGIGE